MPDQAGSDDGYPLDFVNFHDHHLVTLFTQTGSWRAVVGGGSSSLLRLRYADQLVG